MVKIMANAKINLTLDILGKRSDGYHEVEMVMQEIGLADVLSLEAQPTGIALEINRPDLPADETNLAFRAARLFFDVHNIQKGVRIKIEKHIPLAAGLAGGSADAAGTLIGLNELFGTGLSEKELCRLGEQLGSDVPFCICGGTMLATGRGERLKRLPPLPECFVVLAKPKVSVSTAWAYRTYDEQGAQRHPDNGGFTKALESGDLKRICCFTGNVLEEVTAPVHPEIAQYEQIMKENGAAVSMMSGSGPTVFALAEDEKTAEKIASALTGTVNAEVVRTVKIVNRN